MEEDIQSHTPTVMFRGTPCSSLTTTLNKNQLYPNDGFIIDNIQNKVRLILEFFCGYY